MLEGAVGKMEETKEVLEKQVGTVTFYKNYKKHTIQNPGIGQFINADHQPPVSSILEARKLNQNGKLAEGMLEVGTNSSPLNSSLIRNVHKYHGLYLPVVYVPKEIHSEFPSTKSKAFREHLAATISRDDVEGTFKTMIMGGMPRFKLNTTKNVNNFQNTPISKTRLDVFEKSFQKHSGEVVKTWFKLLHNKGIMTETHRNNINAWINKRGYDDQNDPYRRQIADLL